MLATSATLHALVNVEVEDTQRLQLVITTCLVVNIQLLVANLQQANHQATANKNASFEIKYIGICYGVSRESFVFKTKLQH